MKIKVDILFELMLEAAPSGLFEGASLSDIKKLAGYFSDFSSGEYIVEIPLNDNFPSADLSFRIRKEESEHMFDAFKNESFKPLNASVYWKKIQAFCQPWPEEVKEIWFEMDQSAYKEDIAEPCFFFDCSSVRNNLNENFELIKRAAETFLENSKKEQIYENIVSSIKLLPKNQKLFHVGSMLARHQDRLRIFTSEMTWKESVSWVKRMNWIKETPDLDSLAEILVPDVIDRYIFDYDVTEKGVPSKLGINFVPVPGKNKTFLNSMIEKGFCSEKSAEIIRQWIGKRSEFINQAGFCLILNRVCHYKMTWTGSSSPKLKVYLQSLIFPFSQLIKEREKQIEKLNDFVWRVESERIIIFARDLTRRLDIGKSSMQNLKDWIETGEQNKTAEHLVKHGILPDFPNMKRDFALKINSLIEEAMSKKTPERSLSAPEVINLELTTRCPLNCSQCFCDLESGKDLDLNLAYKAVEDAAKLKVFNINLSGGETLVYPHLNELLAKIKEKKLHSAIAVSGWNLNREKLEELIFAGVNYIFISLNGSKESVNKLSRDGYEYALSAMRLLASETRIKKGINWVARNDNIDDFPKLVELAEKYGFNSIVILENKPDLNGNVISLPEEEKLKQLAKFVREYSLENSDMAIIVEECYSPLRALLGKTWIGNRNRGDFRGCTAGRTTAALDVDGNWMPCRHIFKAEFYGSLEEYWSDSKVLEELRNHEDNRDINCLECDLKDACLPCRAAGDKYLCSLKKPM